MLNEWIGQATAALGLEESDVDTKLLLDLARDAAHAVARPAAPLTTYMVGLAVGRGQPLPDALASVTALIRDWPAPTE